MAKNASGRLSEAERNALIEEHLGLAYAHAAKFKGRGAPIEDLRQVAAEALVKAARGYDPGRGIAFPAYAVPTIVGMLKRYFRDTTWAVHLPRSLQERAIAVNRARHHLTQVLGRSPTPTDIAEHLCIPVPEVVAAIEAAAGYSSMPLESHGEPEPALASGDDPAIERAENLHALIPLMARLSDRDRRMLSMRFGHEMSQTQIAQEIGISQMQVSRLLRRCLEELREQLLCTG